MINKSRYPLVSVIVGMYKGEKYIKNCIESIMNQDYENLEIILINDGSPDACGDIADAYAKGNEWIKVIHQSNRGVSAARNVGLNSANGEYICIVDQDDVISSNYVTYLYNLIFEYKAEISLTPEADKFYGCIREDNQNDRTELWTGEKATSEMLYHKIVIAPWNKMISKKLLDAHNVRFNEDFFGGEGFAFSIEAYQYASRIAVGHKKVYHYRVGDPESGASKFRLSTIHSSLEAQQYIKNVLKNPSIEVSKAWSFSNWHTHCDCLNIMVGCEVTKDYPEEYEKLREVCKLQALCTLGAPVSAQQKLRGILFKMNPYLAACIINKFRIRKFDGGGTRLNKIPAVSEYLLPTTYNRELQRELLVSVAA